MSYEGREDAARRTSYWEHFDHDADIGVRGVAPTLAEAFAQAALGLTGVVADPATVQGKDSVTFTAAEPDLELLLVDFLNAVIYEMSSRHMLFSHFDVHIDAGYLTANASGEPIDVRRHQPAVEVKGATFTALAVKQRENGSWLAQCVVDV